MKKSKNITKYNLKWQLLRVSIKGPEIPLNTKIDKVLNYFNEEYTQDAYERVLNYLEGLQMGYRGKDEKAVHIIQKYINEFNDIDPLELEKEKDSFITFEEAYKYPFDIRYELWKDLFKRNEKWLLNGYFQKEINDFMDILSGIFKSKSETLGDRYSSEYLSELRIKSKSKENTHKFFF